MCEETWTSDPFLPGMDEQGKATMVGLMMARKHQAGLRGKAAKSFTAGIRLKFASAALPTVVVPGIPGLRARSFRLQYTYSPTTTS